MNNFQEWPKESWETDGVTPVPAQNCEHLSNVTGTGTEASTRDVSTVHVHGMIHVANVV